LGWVSKMVGAGGRREAISLEDAMFKTGGKQLEASELLKNIWRMG
jgi:hypothetical protein